jgi:hypothetical protein
LISLVGKEDNRQPPIRAKLTASEPYKNTEKCCDQLVSRDIFLGLIL